MPLLKPHDYRIDPSTKQLEVTAVHPITRFAIAAELFSGYGPRGDKLMVPNPDYHAPICFQEGAFYYDNGAPVPDADVPTYVRKAVVGQKATPVAPATQRHFTMEQIEAAGRDEAAAAILDPAPVVPKVKKPHYKVRRRYKTPKRTGVASTLPKPTAAQVAGLSPTPQAEATPPATA